MGKTIINKEQINKILERGIVVGVLPDMESFKDMLMSGEVLRIYIGADPTSTSLHLSHAKNYMFLEELRQLGHEVIVLIGDMTAKIGDPTDKSATRVQLSDKEIKENVKNWIKQIAPLIDFKDKTNPAKIMYNSKWLSKLSLGDVLELASNFTVQQMLERDMFEKRIKDNKPIYIHEFMYPLMQGYDSVAMDVDVELCGTDQTFNALAGRTLLSKIKKKNKFVLIVNLLENPKTGELMSKSKGTGVFLGTNPNDMFGAIMAQPDEMIRPLFINLTRVSLEEIEKIMAGNPMEAKKIVAKDIVGRIYGIKKAEDALIEFQNIFSDKKIPSNIAEYINIKNLDIISVLFESGIVSSKTEARRLLEQNAISSEGVIINDGKYIPPKGNTIKIGPRRFLKIG